MIFIPGSELEAKELLLKGKVKLLHSDNITVAEWEFEAEADLPEHSHPHEQITKVLSGKFELTVEGKSIIMEAGDSIIIHPDEVHSGKSITSSKVMDIFYPVREDLK